MKRAWLKFKKLWKVRTDTSCSPFFTILVTDYPMKLIGGEFRINRWRNSHSTVHCFVGCDDGYYSRLVEFERGVNKFMERTGPSTAINHSGQPFGLIHEIVFFILMLSLPTEHHHIMRVSMPCRMWCAIIAILNVFNWHLPYNYCK